MEDRFVDNDTELNATNLNKFEADMRRSGLPIFNAVGDDTGSSAYYYRINDKHFKDELKIGYTFVMIPNASSQGTSNKFIFIGHDGFGDPLYWNDMNVMPSIGSNYARVNNDKYLVAGKPYVIKCFAKLQSNWQFIITEMYQPVIASSSVFGSAKMWVSGSTLNISTT